MSADTNPVPKAVIRMNVTRVAIACISLSAMIGLWAAADQPQDNKKNTKKGQSASAPETNAKPMTEKERKKKEAALRKELETPVPQVAQRGRSLDYHRRRALRLQASADRRRTRAVHRAVLAPARPHARHCRERIQRRALPPHRVRQ
jgi:hypothetical protein